MESAEQTQPQTVFFGRYPQTETGEIQPIEWLVLERKETRALLISKYALDCQRYHTFYRAVAVAWDTCSLRQWLNYEFFDKAFNAAEQKRIQTMTVSADKNPQSHISPGIDIKNRVFLLSVTEANKYFSSNKERKCVPTDYAKSQGAYTNSGDSTEGRATCCWWLRSPGYSSNFAAVVNSACSVIDFGLFVNLFNGAVRPALWINLES